jgi:hypothetical protein
MPGKDVPLWYIRSQNFFLCVLSYILEILFLNVKQLNKVVFCFLMSC